MKNVLSQRMKEITHSLGRKLLSSTPSHEKTIVSTSQGVARLFTFNYISAVRVRGTAFGVIENQYCL